MTLASTYELALRATNNLGYTSRLGVLQIICYVNIMVLTLGTLSKCYFLYFDNSSFVIQIMKLVHDITYKFNRAFYY